MSGSSNDRYKGYRGPCLEVMKRFEVTVWCEVRVETSRGEYPTISTTRKGDQVAIGKLDPNELGLRMPTITKRTRSRKRRS